ncbi:hypothetical protein QBC47DRAFT_42484 [Echria macrotheca]|uniref:Uncharacterized protein n=1 Tax=Echria macrotheca TaxID=438768 RepID=A0AAJ0F4H8_9PEZI|nr:hypothetical protein QBC47DRAFT_42484 [Echria macrotheca]
MAITTEYHPNKFRDRPPSSWPYRSGSDLESYVSVGWSPANPAASQWSARAFGLPRPRTDEERLRDLLNQVQSLEAQYRELAKERDLIERKFVIESQQTIQVAASSILDLVNVIAALDSQLLVWYSGKRKPLRIMMKPLKLLGRDRDVDTLVRKNVDVIAERANMASGVLHGWANLCQTNLKEVQVLHLKTNDFIHTGVHGVQLEAEELTLSHRRKKEDLQLQIDQTNVDIEGVSSQERRSEFMVRRLQEQAREAAKASKRTGWFGGLSILSSVAIAITCVFVPPVGIAAAATAAGAGLLAGGIGGLSIANSVDHNNASSRFRAEAAGYNARVRSLQNQASTLRSQITSIESSMARHDSSIRAIAQVDEGCQLLHGQTSRFIGELVSAQDRILTGVLRIKTIAAGLHMSNYGRTRLKLLEDVRVMVSSCVAVAGDSGGGQLLLTGDWTSIQTGLNGLENNSLQVSRIMRKCSI